MISAFGIEHIDISKGRMNPTRFARLYPPGDHYIPVRHLHSISDMSARPSANVRAVADSMAQEGQHYPVGVGVFNGRAHLMNGHHRLKAAREIGRKKIWARVSVPEDGYLMHEDPAQHSGWKRPVPSLADTGGLVTPRSRPRAPWSSGSGASVRRSS